MSLKLRRQGPAGLYLPVQSEPGEGSIVTSGFSNDYAITIDSSTGEDLGENSIPSGNDVVQATANFTVAAWFRLHEPSSQALNAIGVFFEIGNNGILPAQTRFKLGWQNTGPDYGRLFGTVRGDGAVQRNLYLNGAPDICDGLWHFALLSYTSGDLNIRLDGNAYSRNYTDALGDANGTGGGAALWDEIRVGTVHRDAHQRMDGDLAMIMCWNTNLSAADSTALYGTGVIADAPNPLDAGSYDTDRTGNLVALYQCGDGDEAASEAKIYDMSGRSNPTHLNDWNNMDASNYIAA